jgi:hypothetical protein
VWGIGVLCVFLFCGIARAQVSTGTISGTVKDSSGAILPGAHVVVLNQDTGITRTLDADENGHYSALSLSPGNYRVTVTKDGFQTEVRTGIVLSVGREEVVDTALTVGSVAQSVVVNGAPPLVESTTASLGSLVDDQSIRSLPLNGRSWDQLALIQPGVTLSSPGQVAGNQFNYGTGKRFSVGNQRPSTNLFLLDGMDMSDQANGTPGGAAGTNLGVDTILEFKIFTNSYKAEYGHSMGSVTTAVTRSGTNTLHGTAFEYIRNHVLDASNFFDVGNETPPFIRNQFGGVLGGPIKKDKTFFFMGYEGLRQGLGTTLIATVPNANAHNGIVPCGAVTPLPPGCPVGGTTPTTITVNPVVVPFLNLYPLPNGKDFGDGSGQFLSSPTVVTNEDNAMGRLDHQLTAKTAVFARYTFDRDHITAPQSLPFETASNKDQRQYVTLQANTVLSSKALNNFRFGFQRFSAATATTYSSEVTPDLSFVPNQPMGGIQLGAVGFSGSRALTQLGPTGGNGPFAWHMNNWQWADDFSYVAGKHSLKAGVDIERIENNVKNGMSTWGSYTFPTLTRFLQGIPSNLQAGAPLGVGVQTDQRQTLYGTYVQDDYTVNSRLTLNLGLRWEATTDPYDALGKTLLLPTLASTSTIPAGAYYSSPKLNFEPRVGLAWQVNSSGKTVVRAGAGIYHNQLLPWFYNSGTRLPPLAGVFNATNPSFPDGAASLKPTSVLNVLLMNPHQKTPVNDQYNLSIQQEVFKNTMVQVAYAGNRASHNETQIEGDMAASVICSTALSNCPAGVPDGAPYYPANSPRVNPAFAGLRYYQSNGVSEYDSVTFTLKHQSSSGLQGQIYYTFSKGLDDASVESSAEGLRSGQSIMYPGNYGLDWGLSDFDSKHSVVGYFTYPLPFRVDSRVLGTVVNGWKWDGIFTATSGLPFTAFLSASQSRNLSTAGLVERPNLNPGFSNNPTHGVSAGCPGLAAGTKVGNATHWYDPCAFSLPILGTYGDLGRNTLIGPGVLSFDTALEKNFILTERANLTFRAEAFNITNHANFGLPNTSALTSTGAANAAAGSIIYTTTSSRQLQFALRLNF